MKFKLGDRVKIILGEHDGKVGFISNIIYKQNEWETEYNVVMVNEEFTRATCEEAQLDKDYIEKLKLKD